MFNDSLSRRYNALLLAVLCHLVSGCKADTKTADRSSRWSLVASSPKSGDSVFVDTRTIQHRDNVTSAWLRSRIMHPGSDRVAARLFHVEFKCAELSYRVTQFEGLDSVGESVASVNKPDSWEALPPESLAELAATYLCQQP